MAVADDDCGRVALRLSGEALAKNAGGDWCGVFVDREWGRKEACFNDYRRGVQVAETGQAKIVDIDSEHFDKNFR